MFPTTTIYWKAKLHAILGRRLLFVLPHSTLVELKKARLTYILYLTVHSVSKSFEKFHFTTLRAKRAMFISQSVLTTSLVRHFWSFSNTVYYDSIVMDHLMSKMIVIHAEKKPGQQGLLYSRGQIESFLLKETSTVGRRYYNYAFQVSSAQAAGVRSSLRNSSSHDDEREKPLLLLCAALMFIQG